MTQFIHSGIQQSNFEFLKEHDPIFFQLANMAENVFASDPNTTLIKLRQFGEAIAQDIATRCAIAFDAQTSQADLLFKISREFQLDRDINQLFHILRIEGNKATHQFKTRHKEAMDGLKIARNLAIWFHQSFGKLGNNFKAGPFVPPQDPSKPLSELQTQIEQMRAQLQETNEQLETNQELTELLNQEKLEYSELAEAMDNESRALAKQVKQHEDELIKQKTVFEEHIKALQLELTRQKDRNKNQQITQQQHQKSNRRVQRPSPHIELTEELTRILIDQQLIEAGWEADSQELNWKKGTRPEKGKNKAIAEWPTQHKGENGRADYVLFCGLIPIAVVEAKKSNANVAGKISQAERYAKGFKVASPLQDAWLLEGRTIAWSDRDDAHYHLPFVYSCNGRGFIKQLAEQSGTWFRDVREQSNLARPLQKFHSPSGLLDKLKRSKEEAEAVLQQEGFSYLKLRNYQEKAITAIEHAIANNSQCCLVAMATGTGKTRTIIGLMYRLLKAERFKRILFLVDRTALGEQAIDVFDEALLEENQVLSKIYNISRLGDAAETETRIQVATVQAMVQRIFMADNPPPIDQFDCIIVDEAHRGYTLDLDMTEGELVTRDTSQYLSTYRRVLDYFDAIKIGLTATPARHTTDIFGRPVFTYSYREAVADYWLIDHEPPIRYETLLTQRGIQFEKGCKVSAINMQTGEVESAELEDDMNFDVDAFNRRVINEDFNRVICEQLAQELDPFCEEKTLIFCATDLHADMVKRLLDVEFKNLYFDEYNQAAVAKITGQSDKVKQLIRQYKNEKYPSIAITVDLLTTGIDVPKICNIVFLRRVKSRILYEQMMGRATRRCDEIGKTVFRIFDPVDIYAALQEVSTMKPLVKDPNITREQLIAELTNPELLEKALKTPGEKPGTSHADDLLDSLGQKLQQLLLKAAKKAENNVTLKQKLVDLESFWGVAPELLHQHLHSLGPKLAAGFLKEHHGLITQLAEVATLLGSEYYPLISDHKDQLMVREQNYGYHQKPEDYLDSFNHFIKEQINLSAALKVVVNRPHGLTRQQLKEIKLLLDQSGFNEASLQTAWRNKTNQNIAASIIGYIRQAAIGEVLIPFEQRVHNAMQKIYSLHHWTAVQRNWLDRLAKQLVHEIVIDDVFVNDRFAGQGGTNRLNKILNERLSEILGLINDNLWLTA